MHFKKINYDLNIDNKSRNSQVRIFTIRAETLRRSVADIHLMAGRTKELRTKIL
ncbi:hypothetical protein [Caldanaerobius polysaccharolyticus]|uniref:hypothetical protein n=1 Tax=Caldanaerobius polysaccharolyticus TaxID=44256 RepID=UPI0012EB41F5|nr:hypothetical protein [Caldanaerobius polysaccharolyticus]